MNARTLRFPADDQTLALMDYKNSKENFEAQAIGLAINESVQGTSIVMLSKDSPILPTHY